MGELDNDAAERAGADPDPPLTVELLADLQAGLLDDEAAARVRSRVRADPQAERIMRALNQVRNDLGDLGDLGAAGPPESPPAVDGRISTARGSSGAAHSARPPIRPARLISGIAGLCALLAAVGVGTAALLNSPASTPSTPATMEQITRPESTSSSVQALAAAIPLSHAQILELLDRSPVYGALDDAPRRASCLRGLGYPASTPVLGAQPIEVTGRPAVLLVLPGDTPNDLAVVAVALNCSAVDTGLMASTQIPRS